MNYPIPKKMNYPVTKGITKKPKYGNKKVTYNNIKFDSVKEKDRYLLLKDMERLGQVEDLQLQVKFELQPKFEINGKKIREISYIADFTYYKVYKGEIPVREYVVEDVKGYRKDKTYLLKKKMFMYKYQTEISEV